MEELGLTVRKAKVGELHRPGFAGIASLYDLEYEKRDQTFSPALRDYLQNEIQLSPDEISRLEERATLRRTAA